MGGGIYHASWASEERGRRGGAAEGEQHVLEGLRRLWRQVCIGAFSVHLGLGLGLGLGAVLDE